MVNQEALEQVAAALEAAKTEKKTTMEAVAEIEKRAKEADDYRQIMNAMGKHVFGYYGQIQEEELEKYWSQREDIVYAHGAMAYYGRENVYNYYTGMTDALKAQGREIAERFYGKKYDAQYGPGYKVMNMLLSPYIEIAGDRQTARGVWMAFAYMTHLNKENGKPETSLGLSRYSAEFIREDGQWKLWHRVDHVVCGLEYLRTEPNGFAKPAKEGQGAHEGPPVPKLTYVGQKTLVQKSSGGAPWEPSYPEPKIPEPYETWTEDNSYICVEHDGYEGPK